MWIATKVEMTKRQQWGLQAAKSCLFQARGGVQLSGLEHCVCDQSCWFKSQGWQREFIMSKALNPSCSRDCLTLFSQQYVALDKSIY